MLLTAMPFVGAAAAEGDVAEAAYIRNGTEGAVAAYTKGEEGNLTKDGEFAAGAVWAYLGVETIAEKDYYKGQRRLRRKVRRKGPRASPPSPTSWRSRAAARSSRAKRTP